MLFLVQGNPLYNRQPIERRECQSTETFSCQRLYHQPRPGDAFDSSDALPCLACLYGRNDGWARSERARLCKACDSLRARQQALLQARGSGWSPPPSQNPAVPHYGVQKSGHKRPREGEAGGEPGAGRDSKQISSASFPARVEPIDER